LKWLSAMSNQLSIQPGLAALGSDPLSGATAPARPQVQTQAAKPVQMFVNPSFQFDPTVGLVVLNFRDTTGQVTGSIPSKRQLEAYRTHQEPLPGEQAPPATPPPTGNGKTAAG
jgi:hypothetical protein